MDRVLRVLTAFAVVSMVLTVVLALLVFFEPGLAYSVSPAEEPLTSQEFLHQLGALADSQIRGCTTAEVLTNGVAFYESELAALRAAKRSIHIELFIFHPSAMGNRFLEVLVARARANVEIKIVLDAIGSLPAPDTYFADLRAAGGRVVWYQPIRWYTLKRLNNRTHRDVIVVDGEVGFIGGAGIDDRWIHPKRELAWRDTMVRVEGPVVAGLQTTFAENWLESTGEILWGAGYFPSPPEMPLVAGSQAMTGLTVISTPTPGRSTRARLVFQVLLASARTSIQITSPYFVPDRSARAELVKANQRGVKVTIVTNGEKNNHSVARRASRRIYGELLRAGVEIHEYQPGMIHTKSLVVDGAWAVVGSTNFDNRSFALNDEVNLVMMNEEVAGRLVEDFAQDLRACRQVSYEEWRRRPLHERALAMLGVLLDRQQ